MQFNKGNITQLICLNTNHSVTMINKKTPKPNITISLFMKLIISSAIIGIPLSLISALVSYFLMTPFISELYLLIFLD